MMPVFRHKKLLLGIYMSYAVHYFLKQEQLYPKLLKYYLGDLFCMPIVLSASLMCMTFIYTKKYTELSLFQISVATVFFSLYFEVILPSLNNIYVCDTRDILCYAIGSFCYAKFFNPDKEKHRQAFLA